MTRDMAEVAPRPHVSFDDSLAAEQVSDVTHEWLEGVVFAMAEPVNESETRC